jgi:hypothetical protein
MDADGPAPYIGFTNVLYADPEFLVGYLDPELTLF